MLVNPLATQALQSCHKARYPTLANFVQQLTGRTDADGTIIASGKYGPYPQRIPVSSFTVGGTSNDVSSSSAASNLAWNYGETTGQFTARFLLASLGRQ